MIAIKIRDLEPSKNGQIISLYKLIPPLKGYEYPEPDDEEGPFDFVVVSAVPAAFDTGIPETYIFPADETGEIQQFSELTGSFQGGMDHKRALLGAGYEIELGS